MAVYLLACLEIWSTVHFQKNKCKPNQWEKFKHLDERDASSVSSKTQRLSFVIVFYACFELSCRCKNC